MNKRQLLLFVIIIAAVLLYCWILFFEVPAKTAENTQLYISELIMEERVDAEWMYS